MRSKLRLALDHNFPRSIVETVMKLVPEAELLPLQAIDETGMFAKLPDWKLLVALHRRTDISADKLFAEHELSARQLRAEPVEQIDVDER